MRGKDLVLRSKHLEIGITPACAGKRGRCCPDRLRCWDHPRVCGEKDKAAEKAQHLRGSPPRMRGKVVQFHHRHNGVGITPACAGKSHVLPRSAQVQWDHPRVCGEKKKAEEMGATTKGSPPRMRGKAGVGPVHSQNCGITPAYARKRTSCC